VVSSISACTRHPHAAPHLEPQAGSRSDLVVDEPIAQVVERLKNRGVIVNGPVVEEGGLTPAFFTDPDGPYLAETATGWS
jgi:hypothetical protein